MSLTEDHKKYVASIMKQQDNVNNPSHYNQGDIECIDGIQAALTKEEFKGYCKGNAMKYNWRAGHKGSEKEDIQKAIWYLNKLIERMEENG